MKNRTIELRELISTMENNSRKEYDSFREILIDTHHQFENYFEADKLCNKFYLQFSNEASRNEVYDEIKFSEDSSKLMTVKFDRHNECKLSLRSLLTLNDLIHTKGGLLDISKRLNIRFSIELSQSYSNTNFSAIITQGILKNQLLFVEVNLNFPALSLGLLDQLVTNEKDFLSLGGKISIVESEKLI